MENKLEPIKEKTTSPVGEKAAKLVNVRSIITMLMTLALVVLLFWPTNPSPELLTLFCTSYGAIITYFFTHKEREDK